MHDEFNNHRVRVILGCLVILVGAYVWAPYVSEGPPMCPFRLLSGLPCPGCGMTRALCALLRGDLDAALRFNLFSIPVLGLLIVAPLLALWEIAHRSRSSLCRWFYSRHLAGGLAIALVVYHVGRCAFWLADGTLYHEYIQSSLVYRLLDLGGLI